jgi:hypothetical protein
LEVNDKEIQVCANDDNLNTTNHGQEIQEELVSHNDYDVEMNARN